MIFSYEEWVEAMFNTPCLGYEWYCDNDTVYNEIENDLSSLEKIQYLTRLFENAEKDLSKFNDQQVGDGLWYLISGNFSLYIHMLDEKDVDWVEKERLIEEMYAIFANFFDKILLDKEDEQCYFTGLVCNMWWDLMPVALRFGCERGEGDQLFLDVMKRILQLKSIDCQESALHGLGHWHKAYPKIVEDIIDEYIKKIQNEFKKDKNFAINEILQYALQAREGKVM